MVYFNGAHGRCIDSLSVGIRERERLTAEIR